MREQNKAKKGGQEMVLIGVQSKNNSAGNNKIVFCFVFSSIVFKSFYLLSEWKQFKT